MTKNKKWYCPHCSQTSSRHGNLKMHIKRRHQGIGQPIREDGWHSTYTTSPTATHYIPDMMMVLKNNNNNYDLNPEISAHFFCSSAQNRRRRRRSI
jgi:hypothetical protein